MRKLKKPALITGALGLAGVILIAASVMAMSCAPATSSVDTTQIEAVVQEYYDAFDCYDVERIDAVLSDWVAGQEREAFLHPVTWAETVGFKYGLTSVVSVQVHGNFAVVEVETVATMINDLNEYPQTYFHRLVCEYGIWKITTWI